MMDKLIAFCKRKGFVFPSSEIYGGFQGVYDYGHYGVLLKNNIRDAWWKSMVQMRSDVYGLDSAIFMHPKTWVASGHVGNFDDPQVDCRDCKNRMRADHILENFGVLGDKASIDFINSELEKLKKEGKLKCLTCGSKNLTSAKRFSLMVKSNIGSPTEALSDDNVVYLRPETCGGIYLEYKNTLNVKSPKLPFGIAQIGKAFRNEIITKQFIFRTREFEQMELQYFIHPNDTDFVYEMWKELRWNWYLDYGISYDRIRWYKHDKLAHYATAAFDVEYDFQFLGGAKEVEGIHARGDWDLSQHSKHSGVELCYHDPLSKEKIIPHIVETSVGLNRLFLMFLDYAYCEELITNSSGDSDTRVVLKLDRRLAPVKAAVFPLLKNKSELVEKAEVVYFGLKSKFMCEFDESGNVGKRYRRQDEIGTPYCITIDFDTLQNSTVTVRDRDTMIQERVNLDHLAQYIGERITTV